MMHFKFAAIVLAYSFLSVVSAITHNVTVGKDDGDVFDPPTVNATNQDSIRFSFVSGVHSVTQSTFKDPCVEKLGGGWDSGVKRPNSSSITWRMNLSNLTGPSWFYCKVGSHCRGGMVFAINPNVSFQEFQDQAKGSGTNSSSTSSSVDAGSTSRSPSASLTGNLSPGPTSAGIKISIHRLTVALAVAVFIACLSL